MKGLRQLRDAVATFHAHRDGIEGRTGDDVLIGPGSKELLFLLQLVFYGDLVIPAPAWARMLPKPESLDAPSECSPPRPATAGASDQSVSLSSVRKTRVARESWCWIPLKPDRPQL